MWFVVGAAVAVALAVVYARPSFATNVLSQWMRYKNALFLVVGLATTWYLLTTGTWYYMAIGAVGVVLAVWAIYLRNPFDPVLNLVSR